MVRVSGDWPGLQAGRCNGPQPDVRPVVCAMSVSSGLSLSPPPSSRRLHMCDDHARQAAVTPAGDATYSSRRLAACAEAISIAPGFILRAGLASALNLRKTPRVCTPNAFLLSKSCVRSLPSRTLSHAGYPHRTSPDNPRPGTSQNAH